MQVIPCVLFYLGILQFIDRIQIKRFHLHTPYGAFDMRALSSQTVGLYAGDTVCCVYELLTSFCCSKKSEAEPARSYIYCVMHLTTLIHKKVLRTLIHKLFNILLHSYLEHYRFFGLNHGVSSLCNGMLGSVFTVKGGISSNLL